MNAAKNDGSGGISADVRSLLERRSTLQNWLANLDNLGSRYRPAVTDRVRVDYQARLGEVGAELESHRGAIESSLVDRRQVKADLDQRLDGKAAEIEEAELRFQIGEFDESTWAKLRDEHTSDLESIKAEQEVAAAAVLELETVLLDLDGASDPETLPGPELVSEPVHEPVIELVPEPDLTVEDAPVPATASVEETENVESNDEFLDELEFLESLSLDDADSFDAVSRMLEDEESTGDGNSGQTDL